jgi:GT2 family glycosyltransferase
MYCDDVDLSWRIRLAGFRVIFQPSAVIFHHKTLSPEGRWQPTAAERYYSAEAALMMAHKWSRPDRVDLLLKEFTASTEPDLIKAANEYRRRDLEKLLCDPIDSDHKIGEFLPDRNFTKHRFSL